MLNKLNVETPIFVFIYLVNVKNYKMATNTKAYQLGINDGNYLIDRDIILPPETIIENYNEKIEQSLKNSFDFIWNACGYPFSQNYYKNGNWNPIK